MRPGRSDRRNQPKGSRDATSTTTPPPSSQQSRSRAARTSPPSASLTATELVTELEELSLSTELEYNPRSFPYNIKKKCWEKAEKVKGRDPDRWRRDPLGNLVFRKLVGCSGCLCHDYDHILPYSKGGKSTLDNCQVLQASVNRSKGNRTDISKADLIQRSSYCRVSGRDMDLLEMSAYGNVRRGQDSGGCRIQ